MSINKLAACVILYNPDNDVCTNIESYIKHVDKLFLVDNGNGFMVIDCLSRKYDNVIPVKHDDNKGIAFSLNEILNLVKNDYDFLMTMDQDSRFCEGCMNAYIEELERFDWRKTIGIGPKTVGEYKFADENILWGVTESLNTSGNIINVKNAIKIGCFDEKLFIDEVDREFNYRAKVNGLDTYVAKQGIYLYHTIGNPIRKFLVFRYFEAQNHNHIRKYYIFRNRIYVYLRYHKLNEKYFFKYYIKYSLYILLGIVFMEKDKIRKLQYCLKGIADGINNRMGKMKL